MLCQPCVPNEGGFTAPWTGISRQFNTPQVLNHLSAEWTWLQISIRAVSAFETSSDSVADLHDAMLEIG